MLVDASVAIKLFVYEPDSISAVATVAGQSLIAPDLIFAELANILWKTHKRGLIEAPDPADYDFVGLFDRVVSGSTLYPAALRLAVELNHPAYDCFYLALAIAEDDVLITADRRFHAACAGSPYAAQVRLLS